jgi:hypothetical protein
MRRVMLTAFFAALIGVVCYQWRVVGQTSKDMPKDAPKATGKETAAADLTLKKLLKTKVSGSFENIRLGEILKDFGDQVDMKGDDPVLWVYGSDFPYTQKVTYSCNEKPLDDVLDQLLKKAGGKLGYVVISREGDKYDGWVRLTTGGERGFAKPGTPAAPTKESEEAEASEKLALAKKLIDLGKPSSAKPVLEIIVKNYPKTKAGTEAKELLEKLDK